MNAAAVAALTVVALLGAMGIGLSLRRRLPAEHLSADSKDAVKVAMGLVATMTALVLGLLVSSAQNAYVETRSELLQLTAKVAFLDRVLALYGPETGPVRASLRDAVGHALHAMWPNEPHVPVQVAPDTHAGDAIYLGIERLTPNDDLHRDLKSQAATIALDMGEMRTLLAAQSLPSISVAMLAAVGCWLVMIFVSFAAFAPANTTTTVTIGAAALSVAAAIFLILELDQPLDGIVAVSSAPMREVYSHLAQ